MIPALLLLLLRVWFCLCALGFVWVVALWWDGLNFGRVAAGSRHHEAEHRARNVSASVCLGLTHNQTTEELGSKPITSNSFGASGPFTFASPDEAQRVRRAILLKIGETLREP